MDMVPEQTPLKTDGLPESDLNNLVGGAVLSAEVSGNKFTQKKIRPIFLIAALISLIIVIFSLVSVERISGNPISPLTSNMYIMSEKFSYKFKAPKVGDFITFEPPDKMGSYVGVVTQYDNAAKVYTVYSKLGDPWEISETEITGRIIYPFLLDSNQALEEVDMFEGQKKEASKSFGKSFLIPILSPAASVTQSVRTKSSIKPTFTPTPKPYTTSSAVSTPTRTPTPTVRIPNPPIMNISYPSENQSITMTSTQQLCLVDTPAGGNTSGVKRKHNINDQGWSSYSDMYTLCLDPTEGTNRIQLLYKNSSGDESQTYTRQFTFHRLAQITVTVSGQLYEDINCNSSKDSGEQPVSATATINIAKLPEWYTDGTTSSDSSGNFSYSKTINENETIQFNVGPVAPSGYKSNPHATAPQPTLNNSQKSASFDIPLVPNAYVSACF